MLKLLKKRIAVLMTFLLCFSMVDLSSLITAYADTIEETKETVMESAEEDLQEPAETSTEEALETVSKSETEENAETADAIDTGAFEAFAEDTDASEDLTADEEVAEQQSNSAIVRITYENVGDLIALAEYGDSSEDVGWEETDETTDLEHSYGDYTLTYTLMYGNAILTGYSGTLPSEFVIPETIDGYTVTEIDAFAFKYANFTKVTVPETVTTIGEYAFWSCDSMTDITLPDSVSEIMEDAFGYTAITDITLPSSLQQIAYGLFECCEYLSSVQIPDSVTAIGSWAFENCTNLESIVIPDSVTDFGHGVFGWCTNLKSVTLPQLTEISDSMFYSCSSLETIDLSSKVTRIGDSAFRKCINLKSIDLPDSIVEIDSYAFYGCESLTSVKLPANLQTVEEKTFYDCSSLETVAVGSQVTGIGYKAFANTGSLQAVTLPDTLASIDGYAFADSGISEIGFSGNAPDFLDDIDWASGEAIPNNAFDGDTLAVFYPAENATWTEEVMQPYGGTSVEWIPWDPETEEIQAYIDVVEDSVDGENEIGIHIIGSGDNLVLECNLPLKYFVSVEMDGVTVDPSNYDLKSGSTIITFGSSYLDTLTPGTHTVTMNYNINGRKVAVKTSIIIKEKPNTSDSSKPDHSSRPTDSSKPANSNNTEKNNGTASSSQNKVTMKTHLVDANGQPMYNCTLEIHSKPVSATLGTDGTASFKNIEVGDHTMYLKDQDGKVLASKAIRIVYDETYSITGGDTIHVVIGRPFILHVKYDGEKLILLSVEGDLTPDTGDTASAPIWLLLMAVSAAGAAYVFKRKRKQIS